MDCVKCCFECKYTSLCISYNNKPCLYDFLSPINYKECIYYSDTKNKLKSPLKAL